MRRVPHAHEMPRQEASVEMLLLSCMRLRSPQVDGREAKEGCDSWPRFVLCLVMWCACAEVLLVRRSRSVVSSARACHSGLAGGRRRGGRRQHE